MQLILESEENVKPRNDKRYCGVVKRALWSQAYLN